jgi:hypothetical protein
MPSKHYFKQENDIICKSKKDPKFSKMFSVESSRVMGKVRQKIVKHIGIAMDDEELEELKLSPFQS